MAVIKPPITGDPTLDSWTNQITQTMNAGVTTGSSPSVGARGSAGASGFNTATISLFARTTTNSAPSAMNEQTTYTYSTAQLVNGSNHDGYTNGIGPSDVWFRKVNAGSGDFIWTTTVSVADTNDVEIIAADSWSAVALLSTSGENIKNKVFAQDDIPTALQIGDLWIDTNDGNKVYVAKSIGANEVASNEWVLSQDSTGASTLAGTKANVFYQDASPIPTALREGDLWYNLDQTFNGIPNLYIAKSVGSNEIAADEWVRKDFVELINNNTTTINGNTISTGSITSALIDVGGINADKLNINGQLVFGEGGAYKFGKSTPQDETDGIFIGNPSGTSNYSISYEGGNANAGTPSSVRSLFADENTFELKNPTIKTGTTTTEVVYRQTGSTSSVSVPSTAQTLTVIAVGGGGGGGSGQSDISSTTVSGVVGVQGGTTSASIDNSLANVSAAGGAGGLSGSNISAGSGTGISGEYGTGGSQGSAGNTGGAGGNASGYGAGGGGSGSRNYGGWLNSGQDAVTNGGGGQAGTVNISGPHDVSSLGAITISSISIGAGGAGGDGNAAGAGGTGSAGRLIVTYTETNLTSVHLLTTAEKTTIDNSIKKYESSHTSVSNNQLLTFAHSLGAVPSFVTVDAIAKTSNSDGWSNGDRIQINQSADPSGSNEGLGIRTDSTNVYITIGANGPGMVTFRSNGAGVILTTSLWNIQVKAFLVG